MLQMHFQDVVARRMGGRYERLNNGEEKASRTRRFGMKKFNGRIKGLKISRPKKLNWKPFWVTVMLSKRISRIYAEFVRRMKMDEACCAMMVSCNWGLPVLSHSYDRTLTWF